MARSVNIEPLSFHNFTVFGDTIKVKYDSNKADQSGENTTAKHVYANPLNTFVCSHLALGIYLCLYAEKFRVCQFLFKRSLNEKQKTVSGSYCSQLKAFIT